MSPIVWLYGPNWPNDGEVDIIEGANMAYVNQISAHTYVPLVQLFLLSSLFLLCLLTIPLSKTIRTNGCVLPDAINNFATGTTLGTNCSINTNSGCNYAPPASDTTSYGDDFNAVGGGVYAMQWTDDSIQVWHFSRGQIPLDIIDKAPTPLAWGAPQALFGTSSCDVDSHFMDMNIVLNIVSYLILGDAAHCCSL